MKKYDLFAEGNMCDFDEESVDGMWVPADVAQGLYDAAKDAAKFYRAAIETCEENGNLEMVDGWASLLDSAESAIKAADGGE